MNNEEDLWISDEDLRLLRLAASLVDETEAELFSHMRDITYRYLTPSQRAKGQKMAARELKKIQKRMKN